LTAGHELRVIVPINTPVSERQYRGALASSLDLVTIGGMPEYGGAVCSGVEQVSISARPRGILRITCMAHGEIGSAPTMFSSLARALIATLCCTNQPSSLDEVMARFAA